MMKPIWEEWRIIRGTIYRHRRWADGRDQWQRAYWLTVDQLNASLTLFHAEVQK